MPSKPTLWGISRNTYLLGGVSFFTDFASEMVFPSCRSLWPTCWASTRPSSA